MPLLSRMNRGVGITLLVMCVILASSLQVPLCQGDPINGLMVTDTDSDSGDWSIVFTLVLIVLILILILVIIIFIALYEVIIHNLKKRLGLTTTRDDSKMARKNRTQSKASEDDYFDDSDFEQDSPASSYSQGSGDFSFAPPGSPWAPSGEKMREWKIDEVIPETPGSAQGGTPVDSRRVNVEDHAIEKNAWSTSDVQQPGTKDPEVGNIAAMNDLRNGYHIKEAQIPDIQLPEFRGIKLDETVPDTIPSDDLFIEDSQTWKMKSRIPDNLQIDETPGMIIQDHTDEDPAAGQDQFQDRYAPVTIPEEASEKGFLDNDHYNDDEDLEDGMTVVEVTNIDRSGIMGEDSESDNDDVNVIYERSEEVSGNYGYHPVSIREIQNEGEMISGSDGVNIREGWSEGGEQRKSNRLNAREMQNEREKVRIGDGMSSREMQNEREKVRIGDGMGYREMQNERETVRIGDGGSTREEWSEKGDDPIMRVEETQHMVRPDPVLDIDAIRPMPGDPHQFIVESGLFNGQSSGRTENEIKKTDLPEKN